MGKGQTFDEWVSLGMIFCASARSMNWTIGDWLIDGVERYGNKAREEANAVFRSDIARFAPIIDTCRRFTPSKRRPSLTFGHHQAVMAIRDDAEADRILDTAETQRLTVAAVRAQVRVIINGQNTWLADDDPEDKSYRRIVQAWNLSSRESRQAFLESAAESRKGLIDL